MNLTFRAKLRACDSRYSCMFCIQKAFSTILEFYIRVSFSKWIIHCLLLFMCLLLQFMLPKFPFFISSDVLHSTLQMVFPFNKVNNLICYKVHTNVNHCTADAKETYKYIKFSKLKMNRFSVTKFHFFETKTHVIYQHELVQKRFNWLFQQKFGFKIFRIVAQR